MKICPLLSAQNLLDLLAEKDGDYEMAKTYVTQLAQKYMQRQTPALTPEPTLQLPDSTTKTGSASLEGDEVRIKFDYDDPYFAFDNDAPQDSLEQQIAHYRDWYHSGIRPETLRPPSSAKNKSKSKSKKPKRKALNRLRGKRKITSPPPASPEPEEESEPTSRAKTDKNPKPRRKKAIPSVSSSNVEQESENESPPPKANIGKKRKRSNSPKKVNTSDSDDFLTSDESYVSDWSGSFIISEDEEMPSDSSGTDSDTKMDSDSDSVASSEGNSEEDLEIEMDNPWLIRNSHLEELMKTEKEKVEASGIRKSEQRQSRKSSLSSSWSRICERAEAYHPI
jgi:hypothetical protein